MSKQRRKYTEEFKKDAVNLALKSPSIARTANELGIPVGTLNNWIELIKQSSKPAKDDMNAGLDAASLYEENRRLHKELAIAREEKEILKKAAAYFAQHQK